MVASGYRFKQLAIFARSYILDALLGSEYASEYE